MSKFSIILPVRNGGTYVHECVKSILAQSYSEFQLAVLDNCSTDGTSEWLESLHDPRIVIYPAEKPLTIEENWHRVVTIPKNEFITLIGHDDILDPHYLSVMDKLITRHPKASLYQTHFRYIDFAGRTIRRSKPMGARRASVRAPGARKTSSATVAVRQLRRSAGLRPRAHAVSKNPMPAYDQLSFLP